MTDPTNSRPFTPGPHATEREGEYTDADLGDTDRRDTAEFGAESDFDADADREGKYTDADLGDDELRDHDRSNDRAAGGDRRDGAGPGAPGNAEPMTDSTDGGLRGGDPGVEE